MTGSYSPMAGHDINYLAVAGILSIFGHPSSPPTPPANILADYAGGGLLCAFGIVACLFERERSGKGQVIDSAMQDGALYLGSHLWKLNNISFDKTKGRNFFNAGWPYYRCYECKGGGYMSVGAIEPQFYKLFIELLGLKDVIDVNDQLNSDLWEQTEASIAKTFLTKTRGEWQAVFDGKDACVVPVLELYEVANHHHNKDRNVLVKSSNFKESNVALDYDPAPAPRFSRTPAITEPRDIPFVGQHSITVLRENGFDEAEIQLFLDEKVLHQRNSKL